MALSILIAKIIAVCYLSLGLGLLLSSKYYKQHLPNVMDNPGMFLFGGFLGIVFGILIITNHNIWVADWTVIVTIIGWIGLIKGVMILMVPQHFHFYKNNLLHPDYHKRVLAPMLLILGAVFAYFGFFS